MPTKPQDKPQDVPPAETMTATIRGRVLGTLGRPENLYRVAVTRLWGDRFRVNILTGADAATAKIANSFFVVADDTGAILQSIPAITRQY